MPQKSSEQAKVLMPSIILGVAIILGSLALRSPLERTADQLDGIRLALADTKQALQNVAAARPAAAPPARGPDPNKRHTVNTAGAPAKGSATAKVKIVEFSDFQ